MSLPVTWKQFQLFDFLPIRDPNYQSALPLFSDPQLSAITALQTHIAFAVHGHVKLLDKKTFGLVQTFCAYEDEYRITFMKPLALLNILVTLAEKQGSPALIKIWDLHKILQLDAATLGNDDSMSHKYLTLVLVHDGDDSYPITAFLFNDSLTCVSLGYANGKVILVRGDLLRDRGSKQRVIYEGTDPITSVLFNRSEEILYVTTTLKIFTLSTTGRNKGKPARILSKHSGADLDCVDVEPRSFKLLVANTDGLTYYNTVNKVQVIGFSVAKRKILRLFKNYLLVVCPMEETSSNASKSVLTKLLVLDLFNMHVSFSLTIPNLSVSHVFGFNSDHEAYLLSTDGMLYKLHEKPINQQIESIIQRDLFSVALSLAKQNNLDAETMMRINKLHAEYSYKKQDYDHSVQSYIECLPYFVDLPKVADPMAENLDDFIIDVVTKFKEVSNIHNMTKFLAKLYELQLADSDHLTLLLCCYCKLRMKDELDSFIANFDLTETPDSLSPQRLDLNKLNYLLIINLFKECGYFSQVTLLLYKLNHPHMIVDIHLNDLEEYLVCLSYMKTLPVNELLGILIDFLQRLLEVKPLETTKLLIEVFTGKYRPKTTHSLFKSESETDEPVPKNEHQKEDKQETADAGTSSYNAILGYLASTLKGDVDKEASQVEAEEAEESQTPTYLPPRPSLVYDCFMNHSREFVVFLEACHESIEKFQGSKEELDRLNATLFEMYASISSEHTEETQLWSEKARAFLEKHMDSIDQSHALLISGMYNLEIEDIFVRAKIKGAEENTFRIAQLSGDYSKALEVVRDFGDEKPALYKQMLKFIVSSNDMFEKASQKDIQYLLDNITKHGLATPLEVIQILSTNEKSSLGMVKDFLIDHFSNVQKEIANNQKLVELYEKDASRDSTKLAELQSQPFMLQNNVCSSCELKLEAPLIHFMCKHSYHQRCLVENTYIPDTADSSAEPICPLCASEIQSVKAIREQQIHTKAEYDTFKTKLKESNDPFKVMTEYIGRGAMDF